MKKIWSILMAAMILCLAVSVPSLAEGTPTLELRPSASSVQPGGEFTVELVIHNNPGIAGIRFAFQYDETLLQLTDANGQSLTDWEVGIKAKQDETGEKVDRDEVEPHHFESWIQWAKENDFKLDFNSTSFSHPKSGDLTLANPSDDIRNFWIEHTKRCRWISDEMGKAQNDPCMMNLWIHDGSKEVPASRLRYRRILEESLDEIFATEYKWMKDCIEAKLFGIGLESYTVGSYDFYLGYGAKKNKIVTLDTGHFHLTESIADKVSSLLLFTPEIMLHVSRPIRWDSDHVVILNDDVQDLAREIVRCDALDRVHIGLDYFDATINRIGAYVIGSRATQKAFMLALLEPIALLRQYEDEGKYFQRLALQEEAKSLPWGAVWDMYCLQSGVPVGESYIAEIEKYESDVTSRRQ